MKPDPIGEAYMYGTPAYRRKVDEEKGFASSLAATEEANASRLAGQCGAPDGGWAPPGETSRCSAHSCIAGSATGGGQ